MIAAEVENNREVRRLDFLAMMYLMTKILHTLELIRNSKERKTVIDLNFDDFNDNFDDSDPAVSAQ